MFFFHPGGSRLGQLRLREIEDVPALPARRQLGEGSLQLALAASFDSNSSGSSRSSVFELHLQSGTLDLDRLAHVRFHGLLEFGHVSDAREPDLPGRLHVLRLLNEDAFGVPQGRALVKQDGAVLLEAVDERDVPCVERVARLAPLQVLGQPAVEEDRAELLELRARLSCRFRNASTLGFIGDLSISGTYELSVLPQGRAPMEG